MRRTARRSLTPRTTRSRPARSGARSALAALGLLAALAPGAAASAPGPCSLRVSVDPGAVDAERPKARVTVVTTGPTPRLTATSGEIQDARRAGASTFVAEYLPPREMVPQVVLIAATLDDGNCGMATLRVGEAGRIAELPPAPDPIALVFVPPVVEAEEGGDVQVLVFAADGAARPRQGAPPAVEAAVGEVSAAAPAGPGVWRARWRVPPRGTGALFAATFPDKLRAAATLAGALQSLEVELSRPRAIPGDRDPVVITVRAWDAAHTETDADLSLTSEAGDLGALERLQRGVYRAQLTMPPILRGSGVVSIQARAREIHAEASLAFSSGEPAAVTVGGPDSMPGDGTATRLLSLEVVDAQGNPVDDVQPSVEARHATVGAPSRVGPGRWMVPYRPLRVGSDTDDVVVARAGEVSGQRAVLLAVPMNRFSLAPKMGVGLQSGGSGLTLGGEAATWLQLGGQQVGLVLDLAWWSVGSKGTIDGLGSAYSNERSYLPLILQAAWRRPLRDRMMLWVEAGPGAARVAASNRLSGQQTVVDAAYCPVASAAASLGLWAWNGFPFLELRATWIGDPRLPTLRGSVASLLLQLGYRFHGG